MTGTQAGQERPSPIPSKASREALLTAHAAERNASVDPIGAELSQMSKEMAETMGFVSAKILSF
jgi:hypothetical protein